MDWKLKISNIIIQNINYLIKDPYGNYVVQYTFELKLNEII